MKTTTKKALIDRVVTQTKFKRSHVRKTVHCFLEAMIFELKAGHRLEFRDFGVFEVRDKAARLAQNPKTLERVRVPAKKTVRFKVGRLLRDAILSNGAVPGPQRPVSAGAVNPAGAPTS